MSDVITQSIATFIFFVVFCAVFVYLAFAVMKYSRKYDNEIAEYAAKRGYIYTKQPTESITKGTIAGSMLAQRVSGTLPVSGNAFDIFSATASMNQPGLQPTGSSMTTFRVRIPDIKSRFLLNSRKNDSEMSNIMPEIYKNSQRLHLEGDFNNSYDVVSVETDKTALLTLLTPDVMAYMADHLTAFDIELIDDELFLYQSNVIPIAKYDENIALIDAFVQELRLRATDNRNTDPTLQPVSRIAVDREVVGTLVRKRATPKTVMNIITGVMVAVFMFLFAALPFLGEDMRTLIFPLFFGSFVAIGILSMIIAHWYRRRS